MSKEIKNTKKNSQNQTDKLDAKKAAGYFTKDKVLSSKELAKPKGRALDE